MDIRELFIRTNQQLNDIVQKITPDQLDVMVQSQPLRRHLAVCAHENACVLRMLAGEEGIASNQEFTEEYLKDDYKTNFADLTVTANEAVKGCSDEDLERTTHMSYADTTVRGYLQDVTIQRLAAAVDSAQAANIPLNLPEELAQALLDHIQPFAKMLREYGVFPAEVDVAADASVQDRLLGLMGRQL